MALNYRLYQSNRKDNTKGKWYARVAHTSTIDTNGLAAIMQANCTVKRSDILAVISELVEVMTTELQNSKRVRIDGFGTFKLQNRPARTGRNPSTGAAIKIAATNVPKFVTGAAFKAAVNQPKKKCRKACKPKAKK